MFCVYFTQVQSFSSYSYENFILKNKEEEEKQDKEQDPAKSSKTKMVEKSHLLTNIFAKDQAKQFLGIIYKGEANYFALCATVFWITGANQRWITTVLPPNTTGQ